MARGRKRSGPAQERPFTKSNTQSGMKRLVRSRNDRVIAGVCAGIADYFGIDPTLIRLLWVLVTIFSGFAPGILAYIIAWIVMPEE